LLKQKIPWKGKHQLYSNHQNINQKLDNKTFVLQCLYITVFIKTTMFVDILFCFSFACSIWLHNERIKSSCFLVNSIKTEQIFIFQITKNLSGVDKVRIWIRYGKWII
jgi:hypothetical protein